MKNTKLSKLGGGVIQELLLLSNFSSSLRLLVF